MHLKKNLQRGGGYSWTLRNITAANFREFSELTTNAKVPLEYTRSVGG